MQPLRLQPNAKIIKVIEGAGCRTASFQRVESDDGRVVVLQGSNQQYSARTHNEIDPVIPGFRSYLVSFDGGEEERVRYDDDPHGS